MASHIFVAAVVLAAGVAAAATIHAAGVELDLRKLPECLLLAAGFVVARSLAIEVDVRRDSARIAPTEIPLIIGLLLLPGPTVLAAYVGVVVIARLIRRDSWPKLLFNVSYATLTVAVTDLLADLVVEPVWPGVPQWSAVLAGFVVAHAFTCGLTWAFVVLLDPERPVARARPVVHGYVTSLLNAGLGLAAVELVLRVGWGGLLVGLLTMIVAAVYRAYYGLLREQRDLSVLNGLSLQVAVAGQGEPNDRPYLDKGGWGAAMELAREQCNATRVVLHWISDENGPQTVVAGEPLPGPLSHSDVVAVVSADRRAGTRQVQHMVAAGSSNPAVVAALVTRKASEMLVAPLRGAEQLLGVIEVHDRQSRLRGFGKADARLVETLASHLSTALDNRRLLAQLRHDAYHDSLTNLRSRLGFRAAASEALHRGSTACAVIVIDLDLMSQVNDALGHVWGDRVVVGAGERLRHALPDQALAARLEGDTFAALLVDTGPHQALQVAKQLQVALSQPYPVDKLAVECTAVVGVALTGIEPTRDADLLLQRADMALRAARGADETVRSYVPSMGQLLLRRFHLVTQFRHALDSGQFDVHYQPQLALTSRQVIGVEALVRWQHPEFGMLDPQEFVSIVEATGLIDSLTDFVLDRALWQCRSWRDRGLSLSVSVNLSVRNLDDTEFPSRVAGALQRHQVDPQLLILELTESAVMSDPERALPVLRGLHGLGVRISVDDFGTGYSSLAYLRRLPVSEVKIDKSFVFGLASDLGDLAVVRAIVELGHSLGLTVVAEGVEQDATRRQLAKMGCDVAQGFLISRPLAVDRFDAWLATCTERAIGAHDETVLTLVR
ncbi:MAG: putative bifunctional diguanylate cyclase/phosphodiesterase [Pseudonocardiaceae bacterium]